MKAIIHAVAAGTTKRPRPNGLGGYTVCPCAAYVIEEPRLDKTEIVYLCLN